MSQQPFATETTGKWILLGEHSVIRNHPALVFPLTSQKLRLRAIPRRAAGIGRAAAITSRIQPQLAEAVDRALRGMQRFAASRGRPFSTPDVDFEVDSAIPLSAGLGSSAALCVALGRFLSSQGALRPDEIFSACKAMEDEFHGKSSGMDLAVVIRGRPLLYRRESEPREVALSWRPKFYLADSGLRSSTAASVKQVEALRERDSGIFAALDARMAVAVEEAHAALMSEASDRQLRLVQAMERGADCFDSWGLVPPAMREKMDALLGAGALAAKPTGSGGGGFILTLWENEPPAELGLLPAFEEI